MLVPAKASGSGEIAQRWMEMVLGEKFQSDFTVVLRAGVALCDLANKVFKALGMKDKVLALGGGHDEDMEDVATLGADPRYASSRPPHGATQNILAYLGCVGWRWAVCCFLSCVCCKCLTTCMSDSNVL